MAMEGSPSFSNCQYCGKEESNPTQRIRACTRCFAVGYCSKECQRSDWSGKGGHKRKCRPMNATTETTRSQAADDATAGPTTKDMVRLEVQRNSGDGKEEVWEDVGPITMLGDAMASTSILTNQPSLADNINTTKSNLKKDLPASTLRILGPESSSSKYQYRHSSDGVDGNLLLFLHGAGDSHVPFDALAQTMALPQTATLSLSASISLKNVASSGSVSSFVPLPFGLGSTWFEEMDYQVTGDALPKDHPRRLTSLSRAVTLLDSIVCSLITTAADTTTTTWIPERIFLFGFSAGACLAMELCRMWRNAGRRPLGGAICIAGGVLTKEELPGITMQRRGTASMQQQQQQQATDVLILTGSNDAQYPKENATLSKQLYHPSKVNIHIQSGKGHAMIGTKEEMQVVMEFLSQRLVKRMISMEGWQEMTVNNK